ncbi:uracil-xanthine permease family protein [Haloferax volcanii]|uniref:Xanthine/uracil permease family transport protein n=3 Tax=Haloferax volcanii TaxID=2246 RepID=D4GVW5_HALVD|nr:nucleobase:cation symporter-2 family protein [Haloferax volcanii]ADE03519.1 xanthine/uracil permease family transport protein [Haloferax volcanii DS2]ELY33474.1 Xanthine permease [Haloferax volcanii DS2]MBS8119132.1 purine permease [Haloferax volcanii]MBS8124145.1 purine permease [Haloferax volcanii]MBS8128014.1 purine permease [Haloferax volcanii]
MADESGELGLEYEIDDRPPLLESILLGIQHVSVMIVPATAVAFIVAGAVGLGVADTAYVVQMVLLFSGLATVVQAYAVGPVGSRLPIVMGTSFTFVGAATTIGIDYGLSAVFGAILVTGFLVEGLIGWQFDRIKPFFPPLVTGLVVVIIGLYLVPVGMDYAAGGVGAADYGATHNIGLAALVLGVAIALNLFTDGITRLLSTLVGIAVGYAVAVPLGVVDFSPIADAAWFAIPQPGAFGVTFEPVPIVTFAFLFLVSAMETVGDMSGITAAEGRNPTDEEFRGGLFTDGLMSSVASVFGAFPVTSFSQNVGIVNFTGVMSRYVVGIAGVVLAVLGLSPKVGAAVATIPSAVFGGAVLLMAGMVAASGVRLVFLHTNLDRRNMVVVAASLGLGLGVATRPDALSGLPQAAATFFGEPVIVTALTALVLNTLAPGDQSPLFDAADESVAADAADGADGRASTDD